ncbi:hypothetical protein H6P81_002930 [Aristolochia fimbriata]|uniref:Uncharacterized protein n=1 Tax=Aristolochia fimbriata TaxID=158543 RepID=A0AAV7FB41_ARIFI|nr:hypothetical protein H6P81_002930 [Aristolochia fimbriata]
METVPTPVSCVDDLSLALGFAPKPSSFGANPERVAIATFTPDASRDLDVSHCLCRLSLSLLLKGETLVASMLGVEMTESHTPDAQLVASSVLLIESVKSPRPSTGLVQDSAHITTPIEPSTSAMLGTPVDVASIVVLAITPMPSTSTQPLQSVVVAQLLQLWKDDITPRLRSSYAWKDLSLGTDAEFLMCVLREAERDTSGMWESVQSFLYLSRSLY